MIITAHQPAYWPWMPFFTRIQKADIFVFLDHVQFEKGSFINRQRMRDGSWLTVPVKNKGGKIYNCTIDWSKDWTEKHRKTIRQQYKFDAHRYIPYPCHGMTESQLTLDEFLWIHFCMVTDELGIEGMAVRSRQWDGELGKKNQLILDLCEITGATTYLSGPMGRQYLDMPAFEKRGIEVVFDDTTGPSVLEVISEESNGNSRASR